MYRCVNVLWQSHQPLDKPIEKPEKFEEMKALAAKLSKGLPEVRVDLYEAKGKIYFGEFTFFSLGGMATFHPDEWDFVWGNILLYPRQIIDKLSSIAEL